MSVAVRGRPSPLSRSLSRARPLTVLMGLEAVGGHATTVEHLQLLCGQCNRKKGADL